MYQAHISFNPYNSVGFLGLLPTYYKGGSRGPEKRNVFCENPYIWYINSNPPDSKAYRLKHSTVVVLTHLSRFNSVQISIISFDSVHKEIFFFFKYIAFQSSGSLHMCRKWHLPTFGWVLNVLSHEFLHSEGWLHREGTEVTCPGTHNMGP